MHSLLHHRELGDLKPSQLMDAKLALLPAGEQPGLLFNGLCLERMPEVVRSHVQGPACLQDCRQLAAAADVVWLASNHPTGSLLPAAALQPVQELADEVAALWLEKSTAALAGEAAVGAAFSRSAAVSMAGSDLASSAIAATSAISTPNLGTTPTPARTRTTAALATSSSRPAAISSRETGMW